MWGFNVFSLFYIIVNWQFFLVALISIQALEIGDRHFWLFFLFYRLNYWWNLKNNYLLIIIQTLAAVLLRCSLNERYFIGASQSRRVSIISAACQHCYSSQYLVAKETCCQPPRLSLSLSALSPTSLLPMAWGNSWLSECSSPLCEHTLIGSLLPQKQSSMGCRLQLSAGAAQKKKKSEGKEKRRGVANHQEFTTTCRGMSVLSVCLSCSNENQLGLSQFPLCVAVVVSSVCRALSSSSSSSLHCWFSPSYSLTPSAQSAVLSHRSHTIQHNRPPNNPFVCGRMHMNLRGLVKKNESTISVVYSYNLTHIFHFTVKESRSKMCRRSSRTS